MDLSASGSPWLPSDMVAAESARKASILNARWALGLRSATSVRSKGLRCESESGPSLMVVPPHGSVTAEYSPAGSKMITWSVGYARIVLRISRFVEKDLPLPGLPATNPMGLARLRLLQITRFELSLFCP